VSAKASTLAEPLRIICTALTTISNVLKQEDSSVRLPSPLPRSDEALKDPPKEVALLQDEETLFLDEDTLPAEVRTWCNSGFDWLLRSAVAEGKRSVAMHRSFSWNIIRSIGWRYEGGTRPTCSASSSAGSDV
jgi:hypothetical protein